MICLHVASSAYSVTLLEAGPTLNPNKDLKEHVLRYEVDHRDSCGHAELGRITLRIADYDFKPYDFDGLGTNWPITYKEMSPHYEKSGEFIGVTGTKEVLRSAPDGKFLPPIPPRVHEPHIMRAGTKLGIPIIPSRNPLSNV